MKSSRHLPQCLIGMTDSFAWEAPFVYKYTPMPRKKARIQSVTHGLHILIHIATNTPFNHGRRMWITSGSGDLPIQPVGPKEFKRSYIIEAYTCFINAIGIINGSSTGVRFIFDKTEFR